MESLETYFTELFDNPEKWNYYNSTLQNPLTSNEFTSFVREYIYHSGKGESNPLVGTLNHVNSEGHVFSVFFLGILLYEKCEIIRKQIDKKIKYYKRENPLIEISFPFIWFITSLFHDSGYKYETENEYHSIEEFEIDNEITFKIKRPVGIPNPIKKTWKNYFNFKLNFLEIIRYRQPDHGILAGILLNDTLNKTYEHIKAVGEKIEDNVFEYNKLFWSHKLLNIYSLCSWTVLAHNIFFRKIGENSEEEIRNYQEHGLEPLVLSSNANAPIDLSKHPFLFLLSLVDTIEPSKFDSAYDLQTVIKKFHIDIKRTGLSIFHETINFDSVLKMKNWLKLTTLKNTTNEIEINIA